MSASISAALWSPAQLFQLGLQSCLLVKCLLLRLRHQFLLQSQQLWLLSTSAGGTQSLRFTYLGEVRIINRSCIRRLVSWPISCCSVDTRLSIFSLKDGRSQLELAHGQDVGLLAHLYCSLRQEDLKLRRERDFVQTKKGTQQKLSPPSPPPPWCEELESRGERLSPVHHSTAGDPAPTAWAPFGEHLWHGHLQHGSRWPPCSSRPHADLC